MPLRLSAAIQNTDLEHIVKSKIMGIHKNKLDRKQQEKSVLVQVRVKISDRKKWERASQVSGVTISRLVKDSMGMYVKQIVNMPKLFPEMMEVEKTTESKNRKSKLKTS